jgi:UDPglucose 6-dehydrogenase
MMKISVIGTGYVGLVTGTCLAETGHQVIGVDIDKEKIEMLLNGKMPIYEPGIEELVKKNVAEGRLSFTTDLQKAVSETDVVFIAVGTPSMPDGSVNLSYVKSAAEMIGKAMNGYKVIVDKSTVPIGTGDVVERIIKENYSGEFDVVSNPEFLKEGTAIEDFSKPDRIVIGNGSPRAEKVMKELYEKLETEILMTDIKTAEMIKYASNALLATEISFINSIANICEKVGANVVDVAKGMRLDKRIGKNAFLAAGIGYGGSCFPKDVKGLIRIGSEVGIEMSILEAVENVNEAQKRSLTTKIKKIVGESLAGKKVAVLGLAFKAGTDDVRESPALTLIKELTDRDMEVVAYDLIAQDQAKKILTGVEFAQSIEEAVKEADVTIITNNWDEFKNIDWESLKKNMKSLKIIDGRNLYDPKKMKGLGFDYVSVGR